MELCKDPVEDWEALVNRAKRKERSELDLSGWQKFGFATSRAQEFETLRAAGDDPPNIVQRVEARDLSVESFWERFETKGIPCIIKGIPEVEGWPASGNWTIDRLCQRFANVPFKVGKSDDGSPIRLTCGQFAKYLETQRDDSPLYMFDNKFGGSKEVRDRLLSEYRVPRYFPDDYMALAGEDGRPPYRWIALGPRRSGTVMHQDPLNTSAWNTLLSGRKRWVLLHPDTPRNVAKAKHVMQKDDDDEAINVFIDLLPRLRKQGVRTVEFVQYPGETIFLPGGWWHCVINVDDTVAVTQNYAGRHNFASIWRSARQERPCWSHRWLRAMSEHMPQVAEQARRLNDQDGFSMEELLRRNRERRQRRRERREARALRLARTRAGPAFDEAAWRRRRAEEASSSDSESTVSTSTSSSDSSSSDETSEEEEEEQQRSQAHSKAAAQPPPPPGPGPGPRPPPR